MSSTAGVFFIRAALTAFVVLFTTAMSGRVTANEPVSVVQSLEFRSAVTPPVYVVPPALKQHESLFRAGLQTLPEAFLVAGALSIGSRDLRLTEEQSASLTPLMTDVYNRIIADPAFRGVPSALPWCFDSRKHDAGHYFLYHPAAIPEKPRCIVFLHGYGGNFQFYTWVLKEEFPDAVILAPSWGVSWATGSPIYLQNMMQDAEMRIGRKLPKPWLMAISGGGNNGFRLYNHQPENYEGYVCLAAAPDQVVARQLRPQLQILMLNGSTDRMIPAAIARRQAALAQQRVPSLRFTEIPGDHFFLLSQREPTFGAIRQFMNGSP
ncbi:MAG: alpha/beta hydrolase [Planctomycetaceae bacterium]|nr:alpha/beta hydrolase [Planctomycetaceae bacterium]